MRAPLSWLKEFTNLSLSPSALSDVMTLAGLEVEKVESTPFTFTKVIVAEVKETAPHPNADKLKVAQVFDGNETVQVVCGDPKCNAGMKVALATIGATLDDGSGKAFKIKKSKLRDVESFGMLCSEKELGLGDDDSGILQLDSSEKCGTPLNDLYGDTIFEISLTPNLGHCLSMLGIGRDLSALLDQTTTLPNLNLQEEKESSSFSATIQDRSACKRYAAREIQGVKVGPSPKWMKMRLENAGIRSINNVVDITNYVMLELGQPLHAFDRNKIHGTALTIDSTKAPTSFETLDGEKRKVLENTLMIHDQKGPIAIAGVMGGLNSEVDESTTDILLEAAYFDPSSIRRAAKSLALRSESSARFERGIDFEMIPFALDRAAELIAQNCGGKILKGRIDTIADEKKRKTLPIRSHKTHQILGVHLSLSEISSFLKRLEMDVKEEGETLHVTVPSYRNDIHSEIDLIEEVARIYGYNNIQKREARVVNSPLSHAPIYMAEKKMREKLIEAGLQEFLTCDLISPELSELCLEKALSESAEIKVLKPSSVDQSILRMSLLPGMLASAKYNFDRKQKDLQVFEIGKVHFKDKDRYLEKVVAGIMLTGKRRPYHWEQKAEELDFFDLKGILETLIEKASFNPSKFQSFHPGKQASFDLEDAQIGVMGQVHPQKLKSLDIDEEIFFAQIDLHEWISTLKTHSKMTPLPQFPGSERDWTITLESSFSIKRIFECVRSFKSRLLKETLLLDVYKSDKLGKDKKNITLRFTYGDDKKTIEQPQVEKEHERLIKHIESKIDKVN